MLSLTMPTTECDDGRTQLSFHATNVHFSNLFIFLEIKLKLLKLFMKLKMICFSPF